MVRNTKKWTFSLVAILLTFIVALAGCSSSQDSEEKEKKSSSKEETRTVQHELGKTEITGTPKRVVTLELSFVDSLNALGVEPVGIADDNKKDMIEKLVDKKMDYTSVGTREQPNLEVISSLQPDLIIADAQRHKAIYKELQQIAPTIVLKSRESTYEENLDAFTTIAKAMNKEEQGKKRLEEHKQTMKDLKEKLADNEKATVLPAVVRDTSFQAHTSSSYDGQLLEQLGFKNPIDTKDAYAQMNLEQLSKIDPDILILANNEGKLLTDEWKDNPLWKNLKAVKNNQVYNVDRDLWTRFRGIISAENIGKDMDKLLDEKKQD
ncbi:ABC transporter substrate-binding protein [Priestia filamentosa]|uniref:Iron citrate ABC transporter substrate-binding protein n=1 Tax=Priestia filamentosa TaxID=1402861 RepID=A0A1X7G8J1_9BACI|nr:Fe(3+) dicitrate ABC transporter substrate-binding protein [Priestia filamentosa]AKO94815.1 iron citrate ABC transporter substrate-binding protein [Priestia filamentosa]MDT3765150.1 Fe(3+) dicitrate ABC transporter substrate-binding protein [Priestia filamentosa]OXS65715.1 iron citrate ABC transporter substrate-binding protein [Priestia filamentosa]RJS66062.1 iron citrate ABC transporter substrate-binding protein [Priestia filamentosa]WCM15733.1 Fe(3+) dicitrate ABC transporter substrate-bi